MRTLLVSLLAVTLLVAALQFSGVGLTAPTPTPAAMGAVKPAANSRCAGRLGPTAFVPNLGQWPHHAQFVARAGAINLFLAQNGWTFTLSERSKDQQQNARGVAVRMSFVGASTTELVAEHRLSGHHNYFLGNDASKWRSEVPRYAAVRYRGVYAGVDVRTREHDGHFEYDLLLQPDADLAQVEIEVEGIDGMHLDPDGALVVETQLGPVRMPVASSWQESPAGEQSPILCRYTLRGPQRFGFEVEGRRAAMALVIDPGLLWSTYLGGAGIDDVTALAVDASSGATTVAGWTSSAGFPTTPGAFDVTLNGFLFPDSFVTRLAPDGSSLVYSTYLGGGNDDRISALALDRQGAVTVIGYTASGDFPVTAGAYDVTFNGVADGFVARLSASGSSLLYATFLGGTLVDTPNALALDARGNATITGWTGSTDFPTTPLALDVTFNGGGDAFITRLSSTGASLVYSTFLGGMGADWGQALALDAQGAVTLAGWTGSADFPTTPAAFDTSPNGLDDGFVARVAPDGSSLVYATFVGGTGEDRAHAVALDPQGAATIVGDTASSDFPTTAGAFDTSFGAGDGFVTQLSPTGSSLNYSTYLGGSLVADSPRAVALDQLGAATVAGHTGAADFPTTPGAFDVTFNGGTSDGFVTRLSPTGTSLVYSTYLGGTSSELLHALALDSRGAATVAGLTTSPDFPTTPGAFDVLYNGGDALVTRLDMLPTGVSAFGRSSPGCAGLLMMSATSMPNLGNAGFALTCGNAPPNANGLLALTVGKFTTPVIVLQVEVWVDPTIVDAPFAAVSDGLGASQVALPIPNNPVIAGGQVFAQFFWLGANAPPPCPPFGLSASNALDVTIQP